MVVVLRSICPYLRGWCSHRLQVQRPCSIGQQQATTVECQRVSETSKRDVLMMMTMMMVLTTRVCATSTEWVLNSFMAAEPLFRSAATRTVETTEQKNERWMEGDCHSKLKIENLGPRRARSGRSRCLEDLRKFLECCRRSEAPPAAQR